MNSMPAFYPCLLAPDFPPESCSMHAAARVSPITLPPPQDPSEPCDSQQDQVPVSLLAAFGQQKHPESEEEGVPPSWALRETEGLEWHRARRQRPKPLAALIR